MALTQISTAGVKDNAVTSGKIPDLAIGTSEIAVGAVGTNRLAVQDGNVDFNDSGRIRFGTGNDLQIWHNGSNSFIEESGTGALYIDSNHIILRKYNTSEVLVQFIGDGANELYYDNAKKLETTSAGVTVTGGLIKDGSNDPIVSNQPSGGNAANPGLQIKNNGTINGSWRYDGRLEIGGQDSDAEIKLDPAGNIYILTDSGKLQIGAGQDLQIYHDGTNNYIKGATASQHVIIEANSSEIQLRPVSGEYALKAVANGAVELYYDNARKLSTHQYGVDIDGNVYIGDSGEGKLLVGAGEDLQIYHDGTTGNNHIYSNVNALVIQSDDLNIENKASTASLITANNGADVSLYYNNSKKFETTADGIQVTGKIFSSSHIDLADNVQLLIGTSDDLQIFHNGTDSVIYNATGNLDLRSNGTIELQSSDTSEMMAKFIKDGAVELYHNNSKKCETNAGGIDVTGVMQCDQITLLDNEQLQFGTGVDVRIYHDGSTTRFYNATGALNCTSSDFTFNSVGNSEQLARFTHNGGCELYYDGAVKLATTSAGVSLYGGALANASGGNIEVLHDSGKFTAGAGRDLQIYHDGTDSWVENSAGELYLKNSVNNEHIIAQASLGGNVYLRVNAGEDGVVVTHNGPVELYYDNVKKLETTSAGGTLTGTWTGAGKVLQVVQTVKSDTFSGTSNTSELTLTDLSATITPSSSSNKIMVMASIMYSCGGTTYAFYAKRGTAKIGCPTSDDGARQQVTSGMGFTGDANQCDQATIQYLDSPSTTSATTYALYALNDNNVALYINRSINDTNGAVGKRGISTLTLYEIQA